MKASLLCSELVFSCLSNSRCLSSSLFRLSPVSAVRSVLICVSSYNWTRASAVHHLKEENVKTREVPVMLFILDIRSKLDWVSVTVGPRVSVTFSSVLLFSPVVCMSYL